MDCCARKHVELIYEVADWCLDRQVEVSGAFLTDLNPDGPSFHTAFIAEGIAVAWSVAEESGDRERACRYRRSWERAMRFMSRLVLRPVDAPCLPDAPRAVGGVRGTLNSSRIRIDYVSHTLTALILGLDILDRS